MRAAASWAQTGPPINDDFADRLTLDPGAAANTVLYASLEPGGPQPSDGAGRAEASIWWSWTPSSDGRTTIDTFGSTVDTIVAIWIGDDLTALAEVASNDSSGGELGRLRRGRRNRPPRCGVSVGPPSAATMSF